MAFGDDAPPHGRKRCQMMKVIRLVETPNLASVFPAPDAGQEPCGCDQNLVTSDAVMPTKRQGSISPINRKTRYNCGVVQQHIPHVWQPTRSRYFLRQRKKISSATAFLEAVVVQPHFLETRETSKESIGKHTDIVVIQPHFLEPRETSKESFGKCTELVVVQPHLL